LNADQVDGKSGANIGVNGWTVVRDESNTDSASSKFAFARCPKGTDNKFKAVVGTGYKLKGAPYQNGSVVVTQVETLAPEGAPYAWVVVVRAVEAEPVAGDWSVTAEAICATAGTP
jgi:hypothetical protein